MSDVYLQELEKNMDYFDCDGSGIIFYSPEPLIHIIFLVLPKYLFSGSLE